MAKEEGEHLIGPLRTTVIGSYPIPGWVEHAVAHAADFGPEDFGELFDDATTVAVQDQVAAGLDTITDGEQTRLDFNLSFYGHFDGVVAPSNPGRRLGPPAHDQRGNFKIVGELAAPRGLGVVEEWTRLKRIAPPTPALKVSVPGPYTLSGRLIPNADYPTRDAIAEALLPIVQAELEALVGAACKDIAVDEPSMSCYAHIEDPERLVDLFNRTVAPIAGRARISTHLCFGNYKARAVGKRRYSPLFPAFLGADADELHLEMASREFAEIELIEQVAQARDVAVGVIDVKSYYIETIDDVADRTRLCLRYAPPEKLLLAPDCGLSQTARWASRMKLKNLCAGVAQVREELGLGTR